MVLLLIVMVDHLMNLIIFLHPHLHAMMIVTEKEIVKEIVVEIAKEIVIVVGIIAANVIMTEIEEEAEAEVLTIVDAVDLEAEIDVKLQQTPRMVS